MTAIQFYHLTSPLERVLPKLLEKSLSSGFRALVKLGSEEKAESLSTYLWTHNPDSFLPHGTKKDGNAEAQPIYLTAAEENPNGASLVIITDGSEIEADASLKRVLDIVDARNEAVMQEARARQNKYQAEGLNVSCVRQTASGGWEKTQ
jgi:DNA polymerase-3 subunit chi